MSYTVDSFLEKLSSISPSNARKKNFESKKLIQRVYCNFKGNFGKYQILPFTSTINDFAYVTLMGTREINMPRKNIAADGSESMYSAWIKILPMSAYTIKDPSSGREVSSLTGEDEKLLRRAYAVWDELYTEVDGKNNTIDPVISKLIRRKNYTIFHGYCVRMFAEGSQQRDSANNRENFSALFVMTAKNFVDIVNSNIVDTGLMTGNTDPHWVENVYNRDLTGRKGFMMLSVAQNPSGPGFNISVSHQISPQFQDVKIPEDQALEMENPVETFLGWQARNDEDVDSNQRKLFNAKLITEAIEFMSDQLAKIRMAKQNGTDLKAAIEETNKLVLESQVPTDTRGIQTNDPILAEMNRKAQEEAQANVGTYGNTNYGTPEVAEQNTFSDPMRNPAVSHQDPISGPVTGGGFGEPRQTPFSKPEFAGGPSNSDLPF
jgi:hypothetical protein